MRNTVDPKRTVFLFGKIEAKNIRDLTIEIFKKASEDPAKPVDIVIASGGGDGVATGLFFEFFLSAINIPLNTYGVGNVSSAAVDIFLAGQQRIVMPSTKMLIHRGGWSAPSIIGDAELANIKKNLDAMHNATADMIVGRSGGKAKRDVIYEMIGKDTTLDAKQMIELGIAHEIAEIRF